MDNVPTRAQIEQQIDRDINDRIVVHKANVARLSASREMSKTLGGGVSAAASNRPLVMLALGDSWFDYPLGDHDLPLGDTDVIAQLRHVGGMPPTILNLAHRGDAATNQMALPKQQRLINVLRDKGNWLDGKPDAILASIGGNDIAGEQFCIFVDFNDGRSSGLNTDRFNKALGMVEACYLDLFALRDRIAPGVPIFGHGYDFPIPNGSHPLCAGPWLKPSLDFCNWSVAKGTIIAHDALSAFQQMLKRLEAQASNNFTVVETQGVLKPEEWANELHPKPPGFRKMALKFAAALSKAFPKRVPGIA